MRKKLAYPGSYYDYAGFEKWLSDRSAEGLRLTEFSEIGSITVFEAGECRRVRYHVEPDLSHYRDTDEDEYLGEAWKFVCKGASGVLVYETEDPWAAKPSTWKYEERHLRKKQFWLWAELVTWLMASGFSVYKMGSEIAKVLGSVMDHYDLFFLCINAVTIPITLWPAAAKLYDIVIWNRSVRRHEEPDPWHLMRILRWGGVATFWMLIAVLVLCIIILCFI